MKKERIRKETDLRRKWKINIEDESDDFGTRLDNMIERQWKLAEKRMKRKMNAAVSKRGLFYPLSLNL